MILCDRFTFVCLFLFLCKCVLLPPNQRVFNQLISLLYLFFLLSVCSFAPVNGIGLSLLHIWTRLVELPSCINAQCFLNQSYVHREKSSQSVSMAHTCTPKILCILTVTRVCMLDPRGCVKCKGRSPCIFYSFRN
jgi:hypothetical protein